jgi:peptide/nickel transport system substrate-binding protein
MSRWLPLAVSLALGIVLLQPARANAPVLRLATTNEIATFDPDDADDPAIAGALSAVYEGLVAYEPGGTAIVGQLARGWTVSPDGLTYRFALRSGVAFHDGRTMTSDDVKAAFERRRDGGLLLSYTLAGVAAMTAPDPATFVIRLAAARPDLLDTLAGARGPKIRSQAVGQQHAAGTGPFRLDRLARDTGAVLTRFDGYWGAAPHFAEVDIAVLPDVVQQVLKLRAGALDVVADGYPVATLGMLPAGFTVTTFPGMTMLVGFLNPAGRLANPEMRHAALAAINPKFWLAEAYADHAVAATSLFPSMMFETLDPLELPDDIEVARKAAQRFGDTSLTLAYREADAGALRVPVELMLAQLHAIGIDATAQTVGTAAIAAFRRAPQRAPDLFIDRITPDGAHPLALARTFLAADAPRNVFAFSDPVASRLLQQASTLVERVAADKLYEIATGQLVSAGGFAPLAELQAIIVHRAGLTGLVTRPSFPPGNFDFALVSEAP